MDTSLSVFFNVDRTYVLLVERNARGLNLKYVNSTNNAIDLESPDNEESLLGIDEFNDILSALEGKFQRVAVTLPAENVFISQFPAPSENDEEQIKKLVNFEISQIYPQSGLKDFSIRVVPFEKDKNGKSMMMGVVLSKQIIDTISSLFKEKNIEVDNMELSQFNAHSSYIYNYPENKDDAVILVNVQKRFLDISLLKKGLPVYYTLASFDNPEKIGEIFESEFNKMIDGYVDEVKSAFFFGSGLTKDINMMCWETGMMLGIETKRLNPFRMMRSELSDREKEYCSRVFHLYPGPVGACIPPKHERIKIV